MENMTNKQIYFINNSIDFRVGIHLAPILYKYMYIYNQI